MNVDRIKEDIIIPQYVVSKMKELGITEIPKIKNLVVEYIEEAETLAIDWYYFNQWVAMGYSES